jgi:hypothetical protein
MPAAAHKQEAAENTSELADVNGSGDRDGGCRERHCATAPGSRQIDGWILYRSIPESQNNGKENQPGGNRL